MTLRASHSLIRLTFLARRNVRPSGIPEVIFPHAIEVYLGSEPLSIVLASCFRRGVSVATASSPCTSSLVTAFTTVLVSVFIDGVFPSMSFTCGEASSVLVSSLPGLSSGIIQFIQRLLYVSVKSALFSSMGAFSSGCLYFSLFSFYLRVFIILVLRG